MTQPPLTIVIPTKRETKTLQVLIPQLTEFLDNYFGACLDPYRILLIDDTKEFETSSFFHKGKLMKMPLTSMKRGYAKSLILGLVIARHCFKSNTIIQMDADHSIKDIKEFLKAPSSFGDVLIGFEQKNTIYSKVACWLANLLLRFNKVQPTCGFRLWNGYVLDQIEFHKVKAKGFDVQLELLWLAKKQDWKIGEIELSEESSKRYYGKSKMSIIQILRVVSTLNRLLRKDLYVGFTNLLHGRRS